MRNVKLWMGFLAGVNASLGVANLIFLFKGPNVASALATALSFGVATFLIVEHKD